MRLLVTGDRNWTDRDFIWHALDEFHALHGIEVIIEGEARGADTFAREWAQTRGIPHLPFPAQWDKYRALGRRNPAGPIRNKQMIDEGYPDYVLAFHSNPSQSKGTRNMVEQAIKAGIPYAWLPDFGTQMNLGDAMSDEKTTGIPGPVEPERNAVPDPVGNTTRIPGVPQFPDHVDTNTVAGLKDPDAQAKAPGRPTHGANNNP